MATTLKKRTVVICGGGLTAGLIARQLTAKNVDVLVLERGDDHTRAAEAKLPNQRDELRWATRAGHSGPFHGARGHTEEEKEQSACCGVA